MLKIGNIPGAAEEIKKIDDGLHKDPSIGGKFGPKVSLPAVGDAEPCETHLCNLVMQGGGVLGLAHVGFLYGLEHAGIRVAGVAGTSAGSIAATGLVCIRRGAVQRRVSEKLFDIVASMPMNQFMDGPRPIRTLIKRYLLGRKLLSTALLPSFALALSRIYKNRGLNPGLEFESWLANTFQQLGVFSADDLKTCLESTMTSLKDALKRQNRELFKPVDPNTERMPSAEDLLKVVATAMPAGLKFIFPRDLEYLLPGTRRESPAAFVRASMAIPGFFQPQYFDPDDKSWGERINNDLDGLASEPQKDDFKATKPVAFVDGGLLSNLPVDAFVRLDDGITTIVVTLISGSASVKSYQYQPNAKGLANDLLRLANAVRLQRDRDAKRNLPPNTKLCAIDTKEHNWLNFNMSEVDMVDLFMCGLRGAREFLFKAA